MSLRQLQWWDEQAIVSPQRTGRNRLYSVDDVAEIFVIAELRQKGFSLQRVRKVMRFLQREFGERLAKTVGGSTEYHLLTDGNRIYLETSVRQVIDILKNSRQPLFTVCLSDAVRRLRGDTRKRPGSVATAGSRKRAL